MGSGWSFTQHPLNSLRTHLRASFYAFFSWDGVINFAIYSKRSPILADCRRPFECCRTSTVSNVPGVTFVVKLAVRMFCVVGNLSYPSFSLPQRSTVTIIPKWSSRLVDLASRLSTLMNWMQHLRRVWDSLKAARPRLSTL